MEKARKSIDYLKKRAGSVLSRSMRIARGGRRLSVASGICFAFNQNGSCPKGALCRFTHADNEKKDKLCARLLRGQCRSGSKCGLSHTLSDDQMPICDFFTRAICSSIDCPFIHVKFGQSVPFCKPFADGYCPRGRQCTYQHVYPRALWKTKGAVTDESKRFLAKSSESKPSGKSAEKISGKISGRNLFVQNQIGGCQGDLPDFIPISMDLEDDDSGDDELDIA